MAELRTVFALSHSAPPFELAGPPRVGCSLGSPSGWNRPRPARGWSLLADSAWVPTCWIPDFDLWSGAAHGDGDFLQAGVKGNQPGVLSPPLVVCGQQVDFGGLDSLFHPFQHLRDRGDDVEREHRNGKDSWGLECSPLLTQAAHHKPKMLSGAQGRTAIDMGVGGLLAELLPRGTSHLAVLEQ